MTAPGFDADPAAIEAAAGPMGTAEATLHAFGEAVAAAAGTAAGAAGDGPLEGALATFGTDVGERADERGDECRELSQALQDTAEAYRGNEAATAAELDAVPFGG